MLRHLLGRLLGALPTLLVIVTLAFALLHATPGGPFAAEKQMVPAIQQSIEAHYHLDESLWRQYLRYLGDLAHGDLGPSFQYRGTSVNELLRQGLPVDFAVGGTALLIAVLLGGLVGMNAALRQNGVWDYVPMGLAVVGISLPVFVIAPLLILLFAMHWHLLPAGDWVAGSPRHLVLPALALALPYTAHVARIMRGSTIEALHSPYIRTARAKGLAARVVLFRHALRPALLPLVAYLGPALAGVLTGSIVIETVFGLPGIGRQFVLGALNRDYTVVMGITIVYGALIVLFNLLADLAQTWLDPRTRR